MDTLHGRAPKIATAAAVGLASALALAACVPPSEEPDRIQTSNPSVTYEYQTDEQLIEARQEAAEYCSRFQAVPHAVDYDDTTTQTDLGRSVVFECVSAPPAPSVTASASPELTYTYRTDSELLEASEAAQSYCARQGARANAAITTNTDGSRTAAFRCVP